MSDQIEVIHARHFGAGAMTFRKILIRPTHKHFSKKLESKDLDIGQLVSAGFPMNSATWVRNETELGFVIDPKKDSWSLPGLDYKIYGDALIFGMSQSLRVHTTVDIGELVDAMVRGTLAQDRRSAEISGTSS